MMARAGVRVNPRMPMNVLRPYHYLAIYRDRMDIAFLLRGFAIGGFFVLNTSMSETAEFDQGFLLF